MYRVLPPFVLALVIGLALAGSADAQTPKVGAYADTGGQICNIVDDSSSLFKVYMAMTILPHRKEPTWRVRGR